MSRYRKIDPEPLRHRLAGLDLPPVDDLPVLQWIPISLLVIDTEYQREILKNGAVNVVAIASAFSWQKFGAVVVANSSAGYSVIDGQHRSTAAALRGIDQVPCLVVSADERGQAAAFAAINGNVTRMTSQQIFAAKLAAGDRSAMGVQEACDAAGVKIVRQSSQTSTLNRGETSAANGILTLYRTFGRDCLVLAMRCIVENGDGNPGQLKPRLIKALCCIVEAEPSWARDADRFVKAFSNFQFKACAAEAEAWARARGVKVDAAMSYFLMAHLEKSFDIKARVAV